MRTKYIIVADNITNSVDLREVYRIIKRIKKHNANVKILIVTDLDGKILRAIVKQKNVVVVKAKTTLL